MPIQTDPAGNRFVEVGVRVPGPLEQVWQAIATGAGVSAWFVPTRTQDELDGTPHTIVSNFGPGMESIARVTGWEPPNCLQTSSKDLGEDGPTIATTWRVEPGDDGHCTVRVRHSIHTEKTDWDRSLEAWEGGWPAFFRLLKLYLQHFPGQPACSFQLGAMVAASRPVAWQQLMQGLGFGTPAEGETVTAEAAPALRGMVELVGPFDYPEELILRLDTPNPGLAHLFALAMGEQMYLSVSYYLYGESAEAVASHEEPLWQAWMAEHFPANGS